ncbi:MAG: DoxX family protein [Cyclobacteriaceae bacterium]|nr:DoxX family protein [Cyclobacteriaceae bacterium]
MEKPGASILNRNVKIMLVLLRVAIGWHFLFEGLSKLFTPGWTAAEYLSTSRWIFAPVFQWIAESPSVLAAVDIINIWALIIIGLGLMLGFYSRIMAVGGMVLLFLYYVAHPPFIRIQFGFPAEGDYMIINKNLIEMLALGVLAFIPTGKFLGMDSLAFLFKKDDRVREEKVNIESQEGQIVSTEQLKRRQWLKGALTLPVAGIFGVALFRRMKWESYEEQNLVEAVTGASVKNLNVTVLNELKGLIPKGKIKNVEFSRLILGGNLLSGYSHSRDLIYVSQLVKAYHHRDKIFATFLLAEKCGVDTLLTNPIMATMIDEYWKRGIGKIKFISDCAGLEYDKGIYPTPYQKYLDRIRRAIDFGAVACYIQGETADYYMKNGMKKELEGALQLIRDNNVVLGIGSHHIETIEACVEEGYEPDFWMKTLHHHNYWSAKAEEWHDNMYCFNPERTIEFMESLPQPWIAFKVMAAGAIHPNEAFRYAFEKGADFICAGMYDFQMVEDTNLALDALASYEVMNGRKRGWRA